MSNTNVEPTPTPPSKRSKRGLIIGLVVLLLTLITASIIAVVLLTPPAPQELPPAPKPSAKAPLGVTPSTVLPMYPEMVVLPKYHRVENPAGRSEGTETVLFYPDQPDVVTFTTIHSLITCPWSSEGVGVRPTAIAYGNYVHGSEGGDRHYCLYPNGEEVYSTSTEVIKAGGNWVEMLFFFLHRQGTATATFTPDDWTATAQDARHVVLLLENGVKLTCGIEAGYPLAPSFVVEREDGKYAAFYQSASRNLLPNPTAGASGEGEQGDYFCTPDK